MPRSARSVPAGLEVGGRAFWRQVVAGHDLAPHELLLLREACRTVDTIDRLETVVDVDGETVKGAAEQTVVHPAISEMRQQRLTLHRLVASLRLTGWAGAATPTARELRAETAAAARWDGADTEASRRRLRAVPDA